jgi:hypothetical protein
MTTNALARRLARLEQAYGDWVASLSDDAFDALLKRVPPVRLAVFDAMTDDELKRFNSGRMSNVEWRWHLRRARRANGS